MIKRDRKGRIVYPDGYKKNMYVERRADGTRMHVIEDLYKAEPHKYVILSDVQDIYLESLLAIKRQKHKKKAKAMGLSFEDYTNKYGDLGLEEFTKDLEDSKRAVYREKEPEFEEINIGSKEEAAQKYTIEESPSLTYKEPPKMTAEGKLNSMVDSGEVTHNNSWYEYKDKSYRRNDLLRILTEEMENN